MRKLLDRMKNIARFIQIWSEGFGKAWEQLSKVKENYKMRAGNGQEIPCLNMLYWFKYSLIHLHKRESIKKKQRISNTETCAQRTNEESNHNTEWSCTNEASQDCSRHEELMSTQTQIAFQNNALMQHWDTIKGFSHKTLSNIKCYGFLVMQIFESNMELFDIWEFVISLG